MIQLILITVTPAALGALVIYLPRLVARRTRPAVPRPAGLPIERLAADLRRLLRLHDELARSSLASVRAHRLWAVEVAIGARALEAARALEVPCPSSPAEALPRAELAALLRALTAAGLTLPHSVGHFTRDGRL